MQGIEFMIKELLAINIFNMKKTIVCLLWLIIYQNSFGQQNTLDFQAKITNYLVNFGLVTKESSSNLFVIEVKFEKNKTIKGTRIHYLKKDIININNNDSLLARFNANDLSKLLENKSNTIKLNKNCKLLVPVVLKRVKEVKKPKTEAILSSEDLETLIYLLRHTQTGKFVLGNPIVVFIEDPLF